MVRRFQLLFVLLCLVAWAGPAQAAAPDPRVRFRVTLGDNLAAKPLAGRLLIFMTPNTARTMFVQPAMPDRNREDFGAGSD